MATVKISALPAATAPFALTDLAVAVKGSATSKIGIHTLGDMGGTTATATISAGALNLSAVVAGTVRVTLNANITSITLPSGLAGARRDLVIEMTQDATGGRTVSGWPALTVDNDGDMPALRAAANAVTVYRLQNVDNAGWRVRPAAYGASSSPTFVALALSGGQLGFPASQVPSADPNTLDDYEEGTFTPTITFATPGNLSVAYSTQIGIYTKVGRLVALNFTVTTSSFTHTTASGALTVAGLPFAGIGGSTATSTIRFQGITKAGYSDFTSLIGGSVSVVTFVAGNSGSSFSTVTAADCPTGGVLSLTSALVYHTT